jgi:hypothetical protein
LYTTGFVQAALYTIRRINTLDLMIVVAVVADRFNLLLSFIMKKLRKCSFMNCIKQPPCMALEFNSTLSTLWFGWNWSSSSHDFPYVIKSSLFGLLSHWFFEEIPKFLLYININSMAGNTHDSRLSVTFLLLFAVVFEPYPRLIWSKSWIVGQVKLEKVIYQEILKSYQCQF